MVLIKHIQVHPSKRLQRTLLEMSILEKKAFEHPEFVSWVHEIFSSNCLACIPGKIWNYMRSEFEFKKDEPADEVLIAPYLMRNIRVGDCDDFALFAKTCLDILGGWNTNYLLLGIEKKSFTHIIVFAHRGVYDYSYVDPIVIDNTNPTFNLIDHHYNYMKII